MLNLPLPTSERNLSPRYVRLLCALTLLSSATFAAAQPSGERGQRRGPPPEAFEACETHNQDDVCHVSTSEGELTGTCRVDRRQKDKLLCVPDNHSRGDKSSERRERPQEQE